jgi:hypothetical protein
VTRKPKKKAAKRTPKAKAPLTEEAKLRRAVAEAERIAARKQAFLAAYGICASVSGAAEASNINRDTHYDWLEKDTDYQARFKAVRVRASQFLEDQATERAVKGVFEPNVFQGRFVYPQEQFEVEPAERDRKGRIILPAKTEWRDVPNAPPLGMWKKSDYLLGMLLRGAMPEKYGLRGALEVSGPGGGAIEIVQRLNAGRARVLRMAGESDAR